MDTDEPLGYMKSSDASHGASVRCPLILAVLVCFLFTDGVERIVELIVWANSKGFKPALAPSPYYPNVPASILWILVHFLLAALLLLRTWWGRIWTQAIFVIHILFVGHTLVLKHPELWLYLGWPMRVRLLLTLVLDIVVVCYLFSNQARNYLAR